MQSAHTVAAAVAMVEDMLAGRDRSDMPLEAWLARGDDMGRLLRRAARRRKAALARRGGLLSA